MSGVLRRGSLSFDCNLKNAKNSRGSIDSNLYGGFRDGQARTPEISVIALDFRRYSDDLKKDKDNPIQYAESVEQHSKQSTDLSQDVDSDEISNYMGHYGRWQLAWTMFLFLFQLPPTLHIFMFVFQTVNKDFWCARPDNMSTSMSGETWKNLTQTSDGCLILNVDFSAIMPDENGYYATTNYTTCEHFEYSSIDGAGKTLVEEFNLVCSRRGLLSVVEMCFLAGAAVGSVSSGWISDRFGRKHTLMAFVTVQAVFGTIVAFTPSLAMYMSLRVIIGFASMTVTVVSFVLVVELISGKWRTIIGILNILPVALAYILAAGIAYYIRDWRTLQLVISLPWLLLLTAWYWLPESPRWLLATGHLPQLYALIERAAKVNKIVLPANYEKSLEAVAPQPQTAKTLAHEEGQCENANATPDTRLDEQHKKSADIVDCKASPLLVVFNRTYWRTTCLTLVVWLTLIIIYFGLTLHLSNLGGNIYLNTAVAGLVEALSICASIFVVLKVGIRRSLIAYMLIPGICCLLVNVMPHDGGPASSGVIALAMIAKCVIGANNAIIPTFTAMQYPTIVRNFGVGMGNLASGIGLILVPYIWLLEHIDPFLPMSVMGVCGIVGTVALTLMKDVEH